jgi:hypothetical protein
MPGPGHCGVGASCRCSRCRCSRRAAIRLRAVRRPGRVQHEPPLAARAAARGSAGPVTGRGWPDAAVRRCGGRVRGPGVWCAGVPVVRDRAAAAVGARAGAGDPGAGRAAGAAASPAWPVPLVWCGAHPAAVVGGAAARGCRRRDRGAAALSALHGIGSAGSARSSASRPRPCGLRGQEAMTWCPDKPGLPLSTSTTPHARLRPGGSLSFSIFVNDGSIQT